MGGRYHHEEIVYSRSKVNKQKREGALVMMTTRLVQAIPVHLYHVYTRCITCVVTGVFELGAFYEIDHEMLPPKSPIQLKAIRVVKVGEATKLDVTVSFPSTLALRNYFAISPEPGRDPELDERFVMSSNQAGRILRRPVPPSELEEQKHLESFWLSTSNLHEFPLPMVPIGSVTAEDEIGKRASPVGNCLLTIKRAGFLGWGIRRKVKYIGRHREMSLSMSDQKDEEQQHEKKRKREVVEEEETEKKKEKQRGKKGEKKTKPRRDNEDKWRCVKEQQKGKGSRDRWSSERYEAAEMKLLEIMKVKKAGLGKPIMRQALREEARKHIGDTGLLDHLLKHMAGKVVMNGTERFRRRHNSEGVMEYWLEPADLVEDRRKAGVVDPYWVPPPGWKPGDATSACACGGACKPVIKQLREEILILKRDLEQLSSPKEVEKVVLAVLFLNHMHVCLLDRFTESWQRVIIHINGHMREDYSSFIERSKKLDEEISVIYNCLQSLKEEIRLMKEQENKNMEIEVMREDRGMQYEEDVAMKQEGNEKKRNGDASNSNNTTDSTTNDTNNNSSSNITNQTITTIGTSKSSKSTTTNNNKAGARRSGFRICKPQGTFLWPDMWSSNNGSATGGGGGGGELRSQGPVLVPNTMMTTTMAMTTAAIEEHLMLMGGVPTPPSASSATSAPRLLLLPSPTSPVLTRPPEVVAVPPPPPPYCSLQLQQTGSSHNSCPSVVYHHMVARVWAQTTSSPTMLPGVGDEPEGNTRSESATAASNWNAHKGGRSNITTDLSLATPSTTYQ
ncbi:unnamed protein product [Musa acuminata subsp. malaccensis]|uniref:(wild Malaysian banana) hypothetical protein n=1 Tax=Musa acuminata subsp. malaccensis TaxID=214687 RepID=A0A804JPU0_MUSAM|nr:unnamed protein product [Musa acuminata subsp. malaccensis]